MKEADFRRDFLPLKDKIFRLCLRISKNLQDAEDLTQETLLRAWGRRRDSQEISNQEAFCLTIARNLCLDFIAKKEHEALSLEGVPEKDRLRPTPSPEERLETKERLELVDKIIETLPENHRSAFQLRDIEGLSYKEAAHVMGISEENFKVLLHRARKEIKLRFEQMEPPHGLSIY